MHLRGLSVIVEVTNSPPRNARSVVTFMKVETPEKKLTVWSGSVLLVKLFFLLVMVPLFIPGVSWLAQAFRMAAGFVPHRGYLSLGQFFCHFCF